MRPILTLRDLEEQVKTIGIIPLYAEDKKILYSLNRLSPNTWFTGEADDPWGWRMEIAQRHDMAYGKFIRGHATFIDEGLLPHLCLLRRHNLSADELYDEGVLGREAYQIYNTLEEMGEATTHALKQALGYKGKARAQFDQAITSLQMHMLICINGERQKINRWGEPYGWASANIQPLEQRFEFDYIWDEAAALYTLVEAVKKASDAQEAEITRFLRL